MKPAVRQMRGPGMNLGLKKPRKGYIPKPKPYKPSREMKDALAADTVSYLPTEGKGGKPRAPKTPRGRRSKSPFNL